MADRPGGPTPPELRLAAGEEAITHALLAGLAPDALMRWLAARRWFGAKGSATGEARVARVVPLPWETGSFAVALLEVQTTGGVASYQLPLALVDVPADGSGSAGTDGTAANALAIVESGTARRALVDATQVPAFRRRLAEAFAHPSATEGAYGECIEGDGVSWVVEGIGESALVLPAGVTVGVVGAEQSNTSLVLGEQAILKLFRRLEPGVHPDVELTHFLTVRARFPNTPVLMGTIRFDEAGSALRETNDAGSGASTRSIMAGMLQEYLPSSSDAWAYTLERSAPYFSAARGVNEQNLFVTDAQRLGGITRAMHEALSGDAAEQAGEDFEPEPADSEVVEEWGARAHTQVSDALDLLARQLAAGTVKRERRAEAEALVRRRDHYLRHVEHLVEEIGDDGGFSIRHHGDYHLGQVLRTPGGEFMIIDFEGEPSRPLADRRRKHSALRDVAGMLRSFAYAAATLATQAGAQAEPSTRELRRGRWEKEVREAYLRGYLGDAPADAEDGEVDFLPEDPTNVRHLLALFETEKVFYELAYELNNRPDWSWIPMRGISNLLVG